MAEKTSGKLSQVFYTMQSGNYGYDPNRTFDGDAFWKDLEIVSDSNRGLRNFR